MPSGLDELSGERVSQLVDDAGVQLVESSLVAGVLGEPGLVDGTEELGDMRRVSGGHQDRGDEPEQGPEIAPAAAASVGRDRFERDGNGFYDFALPDEECGKVDVSVGDEERGPQWLGVLGDLFEEVPCLDRVCVYERVLPS